MNLNFLGGAMEVGGSSILLSIANKNILLDAGLRQSSGKDPIPNFRVIQENGGLDAIIISHAHLDHIGCLPIVSKEYPGARIYMNHMTKDLVRVLLYDSLKVMGRRDEEIPIYAENDVISTLDHIFPLHYEHTFEIFSDIQITFYPAGHIAGASCIYIQTREGTLFYSGDFCSFAQRSIEGIRIPKLRPDVAVIESTYGDKLHSNRQVEETGLIELVRECIENKGKMLIPAFALGRAQEVLLILKSAMHKGLIPAVPVYVDGMVRDINTAFLRNPLYLKNSLGKKILKGLEPFYDEQIIAVKPSDRKDELVEKAGSAIFVSSSGMLTGGPSTFYAQKIAPMENGCIAITGYQDEESPGRKILDLFENKGEKCTLDINGLHIPVKCTVRKVALSAHGDKNEIKGLIEKITPKNIFFVHGNQEVIESLGKEVNNDFWGRIYTPSCGQAYTVEIGNPRRQLKKLFPYTMQKKIHLTEPEGFDAEIAGLTEEQCRQLWDYVQVYYENKLFTVTDLFYIWNGKHANGSDVLTPMQNALLNSTYFESDSKRLFLLRARTEEDVKRDLAPKELTFQELEVHIREQFAEFPYKKISFRKEERMVILNFDFPHALADMEDKQGTFKELTGWNIMANRNINNNAATMLLKQMFSNRIKKISYFNEKRTVKIELLNKEREDREQCEIFKETTGWHLSAADEEIEAKDLNEDRKGQYQPSGNIPVLEQNMALYCIDETFSQEQYRPYKKSIKSDTLGKYIELAFISPMIGEKYGKVIEGISLQTGWRLAISQNINLNEVINQVRFLCSQYGIVLRKNPSYRNESNSVEIKILKGEELFEQVEEVVMQTTGCALIKG